MIDNKKKLLYVFDSGPYSSSSGSETLEAVLVGTNFEQDISLLFINNGLFQIKQNQDTDASLMRPFYKTFNALEDFEISKVYACDLSMSARGIATEDLMIPVAVISSSQVCELLADQDRVFTF
ncbi:MAG: sulfurtransferase complex subunit TusC [Gammaproteobacteria bacterium]|nr:sulfurtransferase complex subunit TusC [Gammaproteobacteria bacterium]